MTSANLKDDGYTILKGVFSPESLVPLTGLVDRVMAHAEQKLEDPFSQYYMRHRDDQGVLYDLYQRHPEFQPLAAHTQVLDALETVLGSDIYLYVNSLISKPAGKRNGVPWHQDFIKRTDEPVKYIAWMALDDATRENGCVKVIPGSHKSGFLPWHCVDGETHHDRVNPEHVDESKAVYAECKAGDVLIFNQLLLHASDEAHSDKPRRAFRVAYSGFEKIDTPRGAPIVLRGGLPESIAARYSRPHCPEPVVATSTQQEENLARRVLHGIGWRLMRA